MIYLILAVLSSVVVSLVMRLSEGKIRSKLGMFLINYIMCTVLAVFYTDFSVKEGVGFAFGLGLVNGFFYLASFMLFQYNISRNGVVLSSTFMRLGVLVSTAVPILFFGEMPQPLQAAGFIIAIASILIIQTDGKKAEAGFKFGLLLLLFLNGTAEAMSKVFEQLGNKESSAHFLVFTFLFALVFCLILLLKKKEKPGKEELIFGLVIGIPNFFSAKFLLRALSDVPAMIAYPTQSVGAIVVISLVGILFFKERINKRQMIGLLGILVALILLNI